MQMVASISIGTGTKIEFELIRGKGLMDFGQVVLCWQHDV